MARPRSKPLSPFGERLEARAAAAGVSVDELAAAAGVSRRMVYDVIAGDSSPRLAHVDLWAQLVGCEPAWLATGSSPFSDRLHRATEEFGPSRFLACDGIDQGEVTAALFHGVIPSEATLATWARALGIDLTWLRTGFASSPPEVVTTGDLIKHAVYAKGSPDTLALPAGLTPAMLDAWIAGEGDPSDAELEALAEVLGVEPRDLRVPLGDIRSMLRVDEPPNLRAYLAEHSSLRTDARLGEVLAALRVTSAYIGDLPSTADWHALRRVLELGSKVPSYAPRSR